MDIRAVAVFGMFLGLALAVIFYYTNVGFETTIEGIISATPTTTTLRAAASTATTTTLPTAFDMSIANMKASNTSAENIAWLEQRTFSLVNDERTSRGLKPLLWNDAIAAVGRAHSADMAARGYFSHTGSDGSNASTRLIDGGVPYWNLSAENILKEGGVVYYKNILGMVKKTEYFTFEQLAQNATQGWMNSTGHRENILTPGLDESGMGVYVFNDSYYFTQDFITRVDCGYSGGPCCQKTGYYPWCYVPLTCTESTCG